jgi:G:T/U-mismatch repair DNA glycosylase
MRVVASNRLLDLIAELPQLEAVGFNGATAALIGRKAIEVSRLTLIDLPSSSAALTRPLADKAARWSILARFVLPRQTTQP